MILSCLTFSFNLKINPTTRRIKTASYFKPMNLFLYIPPKSAHPPGCLHGMIYGQLHRFWLQNSSQHDCICATHHFFHKLLSRGHNQFFLTKLFLDSAKKLEKALKPEKRKIWKKSFSSTVNTTLVVSPEKKFAAFFTKLALGLSQPQAHCSLFLATQLT